MLPSGIFLDWDTSTIVRLSIRVTTEEEEYLAGVNIGEVCSKYMNDIVSNLLLDDNANSCYPIL